VPAFFAWVTAIAVLVFQGVVPSYAGISVTKFGSSDVLRINVMESRGGLATKVAAFLPGGVETVVREIDPSIFSRARWIPAGSQGGWTQGKLSVPSGNGYIDYNLTYRGSGDGLEAIASESGNPGQSFAIDASNSGSESPMMDPGTITLFIILAAALCAISADVHDSSCGRAAKNTCGDKGVKCVNSGSVCGIGGCYYLCSGELGDCN
jgi:hypothetical protein